MRHRHTGRYKSRTPNGRIIFKRRPLHSQMEKYKNFTYNQLRKLHAIPKYADDDGDGVPNYKDCRPWDKRRHMAWDLKSANEELHRVEYMSPEEYLDRVGSSPDDPDLELYYDYEEGKLKDIDLLGEYIVSKNKKVRIPNILDDSGKGQEGRHRAYAAMKKGISSIPVAVPIPRKEREKLAERFIEEAFPNSGSNYQQEWRDRFNKGTPEYYMDGATQKIYRKILKEENVESSEGD